MIARYSHWHARRHALPVTVIAGGSEAAYLPPPVTFHESAGSLELLMFPPAELDRAAAFVAGLQHKPRYDGRGPADRRHPPQPRARTGRALRRDLRGRDDAAYVKRTCSPPLLDANTPRRRRAVEAIQRAFPTGRVVAPRPELFEQAAVIFRALHGDGIHLADRLGPVNDVLIALTARSIGAAVVTSNLNEFGRIAKRLPGLIVLSPTV